MCATFILGEPFTRWSLSGTLLVSSGAVLIAIFGAIPEPAHTLDQLLSLLVERNFVSWMIVQAVIVISVIAIASLFSRIPNVSIAPRVRLLLGLAYGGISGILSAHSLLVAKSAVELLILTLIHKNNQFNRWQSWVVLFGLIFLALTQLYYLHLGLKLVSTSLLYPLVFCVYNIIAILDSLIYFKQTDQLNPLRASLIALGTLILLSGVLALSLRVSEDQVQPAVAKSALAPGLGLVEDTADEEYMDSAEYDEESAMGTENQPLLNRVPRGTNIETKRHRRAARQVRGLAPLKNTDRAWDAPEETDRSVCSSYPPTPQSRADMGNAGSGWIRLTTSGQPESPILVEVERAVTSSSSTLLGRHGRRKSSVFHRFAARPTPRVSRRGRFMGLRSIFRRKLSCFRPVRDGPST
ncbi:hypothetical protein K3495_g5452 [Podosphaera aphanis]|nr:hypothetical protein K3495_g5452 [Podosphaera aphanis]